MCTVSWWRRPGALSVRFNRDEQRQRPLADPPVLQKGLIWPRDPQGGGTWICVNAAGTVHCLLNDYDAVPEHPPAAPRSRGWLPLLAAAHSGPAADWLNPAAYLPFHLFRIPRDGPVTHIHWDGAQLTETGIVDPVTHWTTSGWHSRKVVQARSQLFAELRQSRGISEEMLHAFHFQQHPEQPALWPRMSRADAKTVSISEIKVDENGILFSYTDLSADRMLPPYEVFQPIHKG